MDDRLEPDTKPTLADLAVATISEKGGEWWANVEGSRRQGVTFANPIQRAMGHASIANLTTV